MPATRSARAGRARRWRWSSSTATASAGRTSSRAASCSASPSPAPGHPSPQVLLFDEPLSNLDAQLRVSMRARDPRAAEVARHHRDLRHARPGGGAVDLRPHRADERRPARAGRRAGRHLPPAGDAASSPSSWARPTCWSGTVEADWRSVRVGATEFRVAQPAGAAGAKVALSLRPEALRLASAASPDWASVDAVVARIEFLGAITRWDLALADGTPLRFASLEPPRGTAVGTTLRLAYDPAAVAVFPE